MKFKGNEEKKEIQEIKYFHWINITLIIFLFISFLIYLMIIIIHSKQKLLRIGFFIIIFVQIIMDSIITFSLLIMNIIYLTGIIMGKWFVVFPILFNFGYITNILYNIRIMIYLMTLNKRKDESVSYDLKDDTDTDIDSEKVSKSRQSTIGFIPHSFNSFHYFCFSLSILHTIIYSINLFFDECPIEDLIKWNWFYYFMNGSNGVKRFGFFIFHYIFFIISVPYLILSLNKEKISDHILLKRFSIYCIFNSSISLIFPISLIFIEIFELDKVDKENKVDIKIISFIILFAFIFYLYITWYFRINCYYIQYILEKSGKNFFKKCAFGFRILFRCQSIPTPNFIDYNSSFIYHSLANLNDFLQELSTDKKPNNEGIANEDTKDSAEISAGI